MTPTDEDEEDEGDTIPEPRAPPANEIPAEHVELVVVMDRDEVDRTLALSVVLDSCGRCVVGRGYTTIVTVIVRQTAPLDRGESGGEHRRELTCPQVQLQPLPSELQPICRG